MKRIKLTPRLEVVASFVDKCGVAADIGTDHGFIPTYLVQNGLCSRAIASDIRPGPLQSAARTAQTYEVSEKLKFVCAPGLDGVNPGEADTVIIAGMGGETIIKILNAALWLKENCTHLILQPQSKIETLEHYLNENGFTVSNARLVKDSGRIYIVLSTMYTGKVHGDQCTYFSEFLKDDPLLTEYVEGILKKLRLRKRGLESTSSPDFKELDPVICTIKFLTEIIGEADTNGNS